MLTIKAEGSAGTDLRNTMLPDMAMLAQKTGCRIEVKANDTTFWAEPSNTIIDLQMAYDRLYPHSLLVAPWIMNPVPRPQR